MLGYKGSSLVFSNPFVSLMDLSLHFKSADIGEGDGNAFLSTCIVFDSKMPVLFSSLYPGLPIGFKLSSSMAIFQDESDYVFYDEEGFARRFILVAGAGFYVCEDDANMFFNPVTRKLTKGFMTIRFRQKDSRVDYVMVYGDRDYLIDEEPVRFTYSYDENHSGRLNRISDDNIPGRYLEFIYSDDSSDRLVGISVYLNGNRIQHLRLNYDSQSFLSSLERRNPSYPDSNPTAAVPNGDDLSLFIAQFSYDENGMLQSIVRPPEHDKTTMFYSGNDILILSRYEGTSKKIEENTLTPERIGREIRAVTVLEGLRNLSTKHYLDSRGRVSERFDVSDGTLRTLEIEKGRAIASNGPLLPGNGINGKAVCFSDATNSVYLTTPNELNDEFLVTFHFMLNVTVDEAVLHVGDRTMQVCGTQGIWQKASVGMPNLGGNRNVPVWIEDINDEGVRVSSRFSDFLIRIGKTRKSEIQWSLQGESEPSDAEIFYRAIRKAGNTGIRHPSDCHSILDMWMAYKRDPARFRAVLPDGKVLMENPSEFEIHVRGAYWENLAVFLQHLQSIRLTTKRLPIYVTSEDVDQITLYESTAEGIRVTELVEKSLSHAVISSTVSEYSLDGLLLSKSNRNCNPLIYTYDKRMNRRRVHSGSTLLEERVYSLDGFETTIFKGAFSKVVQFSNGLPSLSTLSSTDAIDFVKDYSSDGLNTRIREVSFQNECRNTLSTSQGEIVKMSDLMHSFEITHFNNGAVIQKIRKGDGTSPVLFYFDSMILRNGCIQAERLRCGYHSDADYDALGRITLEYDDSGGDIIYSYEGDRCESPLVARISQIQENHNNVPVEQTVFEYDSVDYDEKSTEQYENSSFERKVRNGISYKLSQNSSTVGYMRLQEDGDTMKWFSSEESQNGYSYTVTREPILGRMSAVESSMIHLTFDYAGMVSVPSTSCYKFGMRENPAFTMNQNNSHDGFDRMKHSACILHESGRDRYYSQNYLYDAKGRLSYSAVTLGVANLSNRSYSYTDGYMTDFYEYDDDTSYYISRDGYGRIISIDGDDDYNEITIGYDGYGNRVSESGGSGTRSYAYGRLGMLASAMVGSTLTSFSYRADGRRLSKTTGTSKTTYHYSDGRILFTTHEDQTVCSYLYDQLGPSQMIMQDSDGSSFFSFIRDTSGDILAVLDGLGRIVCEFFYDEWGRIMNKYVKPNTKGDKVSKCCPFRYRGYVYDEETGLYYLGSRYYDPRTFSFLTMDPLAYADMDKTNGLDLYAYCNYDPVNYIDRTGYMPEWLGWILSGLAIAGGIALSATGVGGIAGGILIGAGAGSLINGYVNKANGGSFTAGYVGGAVSGALCGVGAGLGGMLFTVAADAVNLGVFGLLSASAATSFAGGFVGNVAGSVTTAFFDFGFKSMNINWESVLANSAVMGSLNIFAGAASGISSLIAETGKTAVQANSVLAARLLAGTLSGSAEAIYDSTSLFIGWLFERFGL